LTNRRLCVSQGRLFLFNTFSGGPLPHRLKNIWKTFRNLAPVRTRDISSMAARPEDVSIIYSFLEKLAAFEGDGARLRISKEQLKEALFASPPEAAAELCLVRGAAVGVAIWGRRFSPYAGGVNMTLIDLFIDEDWRGRGLGRVFFSRLEAIAAARGFKRIEWFIDKSNAGAKKFYTAVGGRKREIPEIWSKDIAPYDGELD
jgi:GNAT superfamily N-acetyltransferase